MSESQNQEHLTNFQSNLLRKWNLQLEKLREPTYSLTLCASVCVSRPLFSLTLHMKVSS